MQLGSSFRFSFKIGDFRFELKSFTVDQVDEVTEHLISVFSEEEPLSVFFDLTKEQLDDLMRPLVKRSAEDNLGTICVDESTGKIVGCAIANDIFNARGEKFDFGSPSKEGEGVLEEVVEVLSACKSDETLNPPEKCNDVVELLALTCSKEYQGLGIPVIAVKWTLESHPILSKTKILICVLTNPRSKRVMETMGFEIRKKLDLAEYRNRLGKAPFKSFAEVLEKKKTWKNYDSFWYAVYKNCKT